MLIVRSVYKNSPFEELGSDKQKDIFRSLKSAIINKEYRDISYVYDEPRVHKQAIPLKLIFMEQNWYVAIIDQDGSVEFSVEYTQSIEILPFVKKWLPDLKILFPLSLKEELDEQLRVYLG